MSFDYSSTPLLLFLFLSLSIFYCILPLSFNLSFSPSILLLLFPPPSSPPPLL